MKKKQDQIAIVLNQQGIIPKEYIINVKNLIKKKSKFPKKQTKYLDSKNDQLKQLGKRIHERFSYNIARRQRHSNVIKSKNSYGFWRNSEFSVKNNQQGTQIEPQKRHNIINLLYFQQKQERHSHNKKGYRLFSKESNSTSKLIPLNNHTIITLNKQKTSESFSSERKQHRYLLKGLPKLINKEYMKKSAHIQLDQTSQKTESKIKVRIPTQEEINLQKIVFDCSHINETKQSQNQDESRVRHRAKNKRKKNSQKFQVAAWGTQNIKSGFYLSDQLNLF